MPPSQPSQANAVLRTAIATARTDAHAAVAILDEGLQTARASGDDTAFVMLAKHAGLLCSELGRLRDAIAYYESALSRASGDAYLHLALGAIHRRVGHADDARAAFVRSLELATEQGDTDVAEMASKARDDLDRGTT